MVDEVDEKLLVRVFDVAMKQPFVEVGEVYLTARLEAFNEETFDIVVEDGCVLVVEKAKKIRPGREFAAICRRRMNLEKLCEMNENFSDVFCV